MSGTASRNRVAVVIGARSAPAHREVGERRRQRQHPIYAKPELLALRPTGLVALRDFDGCPGSEIPRRAKPFRGAFNSAAQKS
jgi:hypothetical protein